MGIRVGILGGMFDPIHIGHCILAEHCIEQLRLHLCLLIPAYQSPLRTGPGYATPYQRWMMTQAVARTNPRLRALDTEIRRKGVSYTFDTLEYLRQRRPQDDLYLVIGADQLTQFTQWHRWQDILQYAHLCVAPRNGIDITNATRRIESTGVNVVIIKMPSVEISSTMIRTYCQQGRSIRYLVHDKVFRYIRQHRLYRNDTATIA